MCWCCWGVCLGVDADLCEVLRVVVARSASGRVVSWRFCYNHFFHLGFGKEKFGRVWFELKERGFVGFLKHNGECRPLFITSLGLDFLKSELSGLELGFSERVVLEQERLAGLKRDLVLVEEKQTSILDVCKKVERGELK